MSNYENRERLDGVSRAAMSAANPDKTGKTAQPVPQSPSREAYSLSETAMKRRVSGLAVPMESEGADPFH